MKILMTGASGFIGQRVLEHIVKDNDVIALSSQGIEDVNCLSSMDYSFNCDYIRENGGEQIEVLLHIGAFTPKSSYDVDDFDLTTKNILNTQKLIHSDLPSLKKIIYISTLDVYQNSNEILTEETATLPSSLYGWSKLYCEQMLRAYCKDKGLDCIILRLGHVYGEGEEKYRKVMPIMVTNAIKGSDLIIYGDGEAIRSYIYVDDVAQAIVNSLKLTGEKTINVVGDEQVTINGLAELIKSFADKNISIIHNETNQENVNYVFDNSKLREFLLPNLTLLKDGLKKEYDYMKGIMKS